MKAAVLHAFGETPRYEDFPDPVPSADEIVMTVKAVALENVDRALVAGTHYATAQSLPALPAIIGLDGIAQRDDGKLIGIGGFRPPYGALAEKAVFPRAYADATLIPEGVDAATAAAVPGSTLASFLPLKYGTKLQPGETVLVNGATGFAGKLAVQVARLLGAGRVIGTGRDAGQLAVLQKLGVDAVIDLTRSDDEIIAAFRQIAGSQGIQVILDFVWGHPTELLLKALVPQELSFARQRVRLVQIGETAGAILPLSASALRTTGLEILGASAGVTPEVVPQATQQVWEWIKAGDKLQADIEQVPLRDIEHAWQRSDVHGKRLVIVP